MLIFVIILNLIRNYEFVFTNIIEMLDKILIFSINMNMKDLDLSSFFSTIYVIILIIFYNRLYVILSFCLRYILNFLFIIINYSRKAASIKSIRPFNSFCNTFRRGNL